MSSHNKITEFLKIGDIVLLELEDREAFVSARKSRIPQIRAHQLADGVDYPVEVSECRFEITQRFQYTEQEKYNSELNRLGLKGTDGKEGNSTVTSGPASPEETAKPSTGTVPVKEKAATIQGKQPSSFGFRSIFSRKVSEDVPEQTSSAAPAEEDGEENFEQVRLLREAAENEVESNQEAFVRMAGEVVMYGQVVQLRHVTSQRFVSIQRTAAALEKGNLLLTLVPDGNTASWFDISSGFNTKNDGSSVLYGEMVKFVSPTIADMGWHTSVNRITEPSMLPVGPHQYLTDCFEICASLEYSAMKLVPFAVHPSLDEDLTRSLLGYSAVTIQDPVAHTKLFDVLGADEEHGCFFDSPINRDTSLSKGTDLWRLEPVQLDLSGMPLQLETKIRIRHLVTGRYLASGGRGADKQNSEDPQEREVHLTELYNEPKCLWKMVKFSKEQDGNRIYGKEIFTFLQHDTGWWLTCSSEKKVVAVPRESAEFDTIANMSLEDLDALKAPVLAPVRVDRNVLVIRKVEAAYEKKVHRVCSARNVVSNFVTEIKRLSLPVVTVGLKKLESIKGDLTGQDPRNPWKERLCETFLAGFPQVKRILTDVQDLLDFNAWIETSEPEAPTTFQTIMRDIGFITDVVSLMKAIPVKLVHMTFSELGQQAKKERRTSNSSNFSKNKFNMLLDSVIECGNLCHRVLQMVVKDNAVMKQYIAKFHLGAVRDHLGTPVNAADTLAAVYENNIKLIQEAKYQTLEDFVNLVRNYGHYPRVMNFLYQMCGTDDRPVPKNQNKLLDILKENPTEIFFPARLTASSSNAKGSSSSTSSDETSWIITVPHKTNGSALLDCAIFRACPEDRTKKSIWEWTRNESLLETEPRLQLFIYYVFSLYFLCALCHGRNTMAIDAVKRMSKEHGLGLEAGPLLSGIRDPQLPYAMRSGLLSLLVALYVDVHPYELIKLPRLTRILRSGGVGAADDEGLDIDEEQHKTVKELVKCVVAVLMDVSQFSSQVTDADSKKKLKMNSAHLKKGRLSAMFKTGENDNGSQEEVHAANDMIMWTSPLAAAVTGGNKELALLDEDEMTVGRNTFIGVLLTEILQMFRLGLIGLRTEGAATIFKQLLKMLHSFDCMPLDKADRFKKSYSTSVIMDTKVTMLKILEFALELHNEEQCARIFDEFCGVRSAGDMHLGTGTDETDSAGGSVSQGNKYKVGAKRGSNNKVNPESALALTFQKSMKHVVPENVIANNPGAWGDAMTRIANIIVPQPDEDNLQELHFFKFNPAGDGWDQSQLVDSVLSNLLELVRYDNPALVAKVYVLVDRVLSRRKKLVRSLMKTFIVSDDDLIAVQQRSVNLLSQLRHDYHFIASTDQEVSSKACQSAAAAFSELVTFMVPDTHVTIGAPAISGHDTAGPSSSGLSPGDGGGRKHIFITKAVASNLQFIFRDLRAHEVALTYLKRPLKKSKVPRSDGQLPEADEPLRRVILQHCLKFLQFFMVVGPLNHEGSANNENQELILEHVEDICSHLGIAKLVVSGTITGLFVQNTKAAADHGGIVLRRFMQLLVQYGQKRRADWIRLMCTLMAEDELGPIPENQSLVLQLLTEYEDAVLELFKGKFGYTRVVELLEMGELLNIKSDTTQSKYKEVVEDPISIDKESSKERVGGEGGSLLDYHVSCVKLLVSACIGQESTFVVQATGYMSLTKLITVLLLPTTSSIKRRALRFVQAEYWNLLHFGYFSPDLNDTKQQVQKEDNRIWLNDTSMFKFENVVSETVIQAKSSALKPLDLDPLHNPKELEPDDIPVPEQKGAKSLFSKCLPAEKPEMHQCLMEVVMLEIGLALDEHLSELNDPYSAHSMLCRCIFPSLTDYFAGHFVTHVNQLRQMPSETMCDLFLKLQSYAIVLKGTRPSNVARHLHEKAMAAAAKLSATMKKVAMSILTTFEDSFENLTMSAGPSSEFLHNTPSGTSLVKSVSADWNKFVKVIAISLDVTATTLAVMPMEFKRHNIGVLEYASAFMMARLLTQPHGVQVQGSVPPLPYEQVIAEMCHLAANIANKNLVTSTFLVRIITVVRASLQIDDGHGSEDAWQDGWHRLGWLRSRTKREDTAESESLITWRREKYNNLNATYMAAKLMAHPEESVSFAAFELMITLLEGSTQTVRDALHQMLKGGKPWTHRLLGTVSKAFKKCAAGLPNLKQEFEKKRLDQNKTELERTASVTSVNDEDVVFKEATTKSDGKDVIKRTSIIVRCLQMMVEGHHSGLQQWLQHQPYTQQPVDMLVEAVELLTELQNYVLDSFVVQDPRVPDLMVLLLDFLNEMVLGPCTSNEIVLSSPQTGLMAICNRILGYIEYNTHRPDPTVFAMKCAVKTSMIKLLVNLLEMCCPDTVSRFLENLNFRIFEKQIVRLYEMLGFTNDHKEPLFGPKVTVLRDDEQVPINDLLSEELLFFSIFILKLNFVSQGEENSHALPWLPEMFDSCKDADFSLMAGHMHAAEKMSRFLRTRIGFVEILVKGTVEPVFFPMTPACSKLMGISKWRQLMNAKLQNSVSPECRSLASMKAAEFVVVALEVVETINLSESGNNSPVLNAVMRLAQYRTSMQLFSFYVSISLLITSLFQESLEGADTPEGELGYRIIETAINLVNAIQCLCSTLVLLAYLATDLRMHIRAHSDKLEAERIKALEEASQEDDTPDDPTDDIDNVIVTGIRGAASGETKSVAIPVPPAVQDGENTYDLKVIVKMIQGYFQYIFVVLFDKYLWYIGILEMASLLGFFGPSHWLTVMLIIYFVDSEAGSTIIGAMGRIAGSIVNTFVLGILTIFIFAMTIYNVFRDNPSENQPPCATLYQCIGSSIVAGIGQGDISVMFHEEIWTDVPEKFYEDPYKQVRTLMTLLFFMVWEYVLLNVFVGLIASAFEAMRDDVNTVHEDSTSKCLICSRDMYDFERFTKTGFKHHVEFQHNPLSYVYYLHYLKTTSDTEYTGPDSWVFDKLKFSVNEEDKASWLPINRALSLRKHEEHEQQEQLQQQQEVTNQVSLLFEKHKKETDEKLHSMSVAVEGILSILKQNLDHGGQFSRTQTI